MNKVAGALALLLGQAVSGMPLALALAVLLAQALVRARAEAALSCEEAASAPLVALERPCTAAAGASHFVCNQRLPLARHQNDAQTLTAFSVLARAPARLETAAGDLAFCVGLEELLKSDIYTPEGYYLDQRNTFARDLAVGVVDRNFVLRRLVRALERPPDCFRLCLYDRDFRLGTHIVSNIVDAIDCSSKVMVVLTQHFIASKVPALHSAALA
ncbi:Protein toll [Gryllus bimaculatus]|nr:Protein toll [Gryllus bimaculatus]